MRFLSLKTLNIYYKLVNIIFFALIYFVADAKGAGIFFLGFSFFGFIYYLLFGSLKNTIEVMVSARNYRGLHNNARSILRFGLLYSLAAGILLTAVLFLISDYIALGLTGYRLPRYIFAFFGIYATLKSVKECLKGFHRGKGSMVFDIIGDVLYGPLLLISGWLIINAMKAYGAKVAVLLKNPLMEYLYGVYGAICSLALTLFINILLLVAGIFLMRGKEDASGSTAETGKGIINNFISGTISFWIKNLFPVAGIFIVSFLYVKSAFKLSAGEDLVYRDMGVFAMQYLTPLAVPMVFLQEYINRELRFISKDYLRDDFRTIRVRFSFLIKNIFFILLPFVFSYIFIGTTIAGTLFGGEAAMGGQMLSAGGFLMILFALSYMSAGVLNILGQKLYVIIGGAINIVVPVFLFAVLFSKEPRIVRIIIPIILGYVGSTLLTMFLDFKILGGNLTDIGMKIAKCVLGAITMGLIQLILDKIIKMNIIILLPVLAASIIIYILIVFLLRGISNKDISSLKGTLFFYPAKYISSLFYERY